MKALLGKLRDGVRLLTEPRGGGDQQTEARRRAAGGQVRKPRDVVLSQGSIER